MKSRRPGLQQSWKYVFDSLESIIPIYRQGSRLIALRADETMRREAVERVVHGGDLVLDLGSGPGLMADIVAGLGAEPILLDASRKMLSRRCGLERVQGTFEHLPFRSSAFECVVAGFALRDSRDLLLAVSEVKRTLKTGGRFSFCDLGKPDSAAGALAVGIYLRVMPSLFGLMTGRKVGLKFGSLFTTYMLTLRNKDLALRLERFFPRVRLSERQLGAAIVVECQ